MLFYSKLNKSNLILTSLNTTDDDRVSGIKVGDHFTGDRLNLQTNVSTRAETFVLNASGLVHALENASIKLKQKQKYN